MNPPGIAPRLGPRAALAFHLAPEPASRWLGASVTMAVVLCAALGLSPLRGWSQGPPEALVSQVHWITLHTRTPAAFETVCALLGGELQLPVFFGPETHGPRRYQALLADPVILEVCGPFADSPYRATNVLARYNTLMFRAATSAVASSAGLSSRGLAHEPPRAEPWDKAQLAVNVTALGAPGLPVSVVERVEDAEGFNRQLRSLRDSFKDGGPLGLRGLEEVQISYSTEDELAGWRTLLGPMAPTNGLWKLAVGPGLRLVRSDRAEVAALVFRVQSLARAEQQLKQRGLLGESRAGLVSLSPERACGLKFLFRASPGSSPSP
jgi:hypothetical protein